MKRNQNFSSIHPFLALLTPLTLTPFPTEEITGCINEETKGANKALRIHVLFLFHAILFEYVHQVIHLNHLMILKF